LLKVKDGEIVGWPGFISRLMIKIRTIPGFSGIASANITNMP
jgi:hypothetical protein